MPTSRQQKRLEIQRQIIKHFDEKIPYFTDIFDERTFYIFFGLLTIIAFLIVFILAYCCKIQIKDADELRREKERKERKRKQKLAEKLLKEKLENSKPNTDEYFDVKRKLDILYKAMKEKSEDSDEDEINRFYDDDNDAFNDGTCTENTSVGSRQNLLKSD